MFHLDSFPRRRVLALLLVLSLSLPLGACGGGSAPDSAPQEQVLRPVLPGQGLELFQLGFAFYQLQQSFTPWGRLKIAILQILQATALEKGYLNIVSQDMWLTQNMPIGFGDATELTTYFDLGTPLGMPIDEYELRVFMTEEPLVELPSQVFDEPLLPFGVEPFEYGAEGRGPDPVVLLPIPPAPRDFSFKFDLLEVDSLSTQQVVNLQTADHQCGPMAIANSLQYLENAGRINVASQHKVGLRGDNSLVGQLGNAMTRGARSRADGDTVTDTTFMNGKFAFESGAGIALTHRFQQATDRIYLPTDGNQEFTGSGLKAKDESTRVGITFAWIAARVKAGDDLEAGIAYDNGGGHWVRIDGVMKINGIPFIRYSHDASQTSNDAGDTLGLETVWVPLVDTDGDGKLNLAPGTELELVIAEG